MSQALAAAPQGIAAAPIGTDKVTHDQMQEAVAVAVAIAVVKVPESIQAAATEEKRLGNVNSISPKQPPHELPLDPSSRSKSAPGSPTSPKLLDRHIMTADPSRGGAITTETAFAITHEVGNLGDAAAAAAAAADSHGGPVAPPLSIVPPSPRDTTLLSPTTATTTSINVHSPSAEDHHHHGPSLSHIFSSLHHKSADAVPTVSSPHEVKMPFLQSVPGTAAHRRRSMANTNAITDYEADLTGRDRAKQKEAVKKYLQERVKDSWEWEWPRREQDSSPDDTPNADIHDPLELVWKERDEWVSDASDSEPELLSPALKALERRDSAVASPFRFESPDGVGETIKKTELERKIRRKRRLREEMEWNVGVRCFMERRDAWTGARHVSRRVRHQLAQRASISSGDGGSSTALDHDDDDEDWVDEDTEIPVAPPLIPPTNAMRASVTPNAYNTIYEKVVLHSLTPSCPVNLKDVTRSCVQGWKRDGEWPPKSIPIEPPKAKRNRRKLSVAGIFGLDKHDKDKEKDKKEDGAGGIRKSLQRLLTLGKDHGHGNSVPSTPTAAQHGNGEQQSPKPDGVVNAA